MRTMTSPARGGSICTCSRLSGCPNAFRTAAFMLPRAYRARQALRGRPSHTGRVDSDLSATARLTAALRALESSRADPLVLDPWAAALAGGDFVASLAGQPPYVQARAASYTIVRMRVFDDWLRSVADCPQVVLLGAGFDTRAFRAAWPADTRLWELDQAEVLNRKEAILREAEAIARC